jgi:hypothetical protein
MYVCMYDCYHDEFRYLNVFHHIVIGYVEDKHLPSLSNEYALLRCSCFRNECMCVCMIVTMMSFDTLMFSIT